MNGKIYRTKLQIFTMDVSNFRRHDANLLANLNIVKEENPSL